MIRQEDEQQVGDGFTDILRVENREYGLVARGVTILAEHQKLAGGEIKSPYWQTSGQGASPLAEYYRNGLRIKVGTVSSFAAEELAVVIDTTIRSYLEQGAFVDVSDDRERSRIVQAMAGGFDDPERLVIAVYNQDGSHYVGGCMVARSRREVSFIENIGNPESELPTLVALRFGLNGFSTEGLLETDVACPTRFARLPDRLFKPATACTDDESLRQGLSGFSREVLINMATAANLSWGRKKMSILDTHDGGIVKTLSKYYGGVVIDPEPVVTESVAFPQPLGYHYSKIRGIQVIGFDFTKQLELAIREEEKLGERHAINLDSGLMFFPQPAPEVTYAT